MAPRTSSPSSPARPAPTAGTSDPAAQPTLATGSTTGRFLILLEPDEIKGASASLHERAGVRLAALGGTESVDDTGRMREGEGIVFNDLGVAIVHAAPDRFSALSSAVATTSALQSMEPERYVYTIGGIDLSYLRGYRDAINHLYDQHAKANGMESALSIDQGSGSLSWGLQATGVGMSRYTGRGVRIAVLDTGLDLAHPDFIGRAIETRSFVEGQSVQDGNGHGTHCCGIACGSRQPQRLPRFGIACDADLYVGKVLDDSGQGTDGNIIAGIQWALASGCCVVSMSLGAPVLPGQNYSPTFQQIARRALDRGSIIVVAAGNDSDRRRGVVAPVNHPANCPGMVAVAAVDRRLVPAFFSNAGNAASGTKIDIAGPGVDVVSSWPVPTLYKTEDGTSMATPHVAGIAALHAEADASIRGRSLLAELVQRAKPLPASNEDVGMGLVQAP